MKIVFEKRIIEQTKNYVKQALSDDSSGHDWWHVYRVYNNANRILENEEGDPFVVELAALLHDIADWKFHDGDETVGPHVARKWLYSLSVEEKVIEHVCDIIKCISFKGAGVVSSMGSIEGEIVQDADRLDALGAVGIARVFIYGGYKGQPLYDPAIKPIFHTNFEDYQRDKTTIINHFYENLLLLKDRMNTVTGKYIAENRHAYVLQYLDIFLSEWNGLDSEKFAFRDS